MALLKRRYEIRFRQTQSRNILKGSRNHEWPAWWTDDGEYSESSKASTNKPENPRRRKNHYINCKMCPPRRKTRFAWLIKLFTLGLCYYLLNICMIKMAAVVFRQLVLDALFNLIYNCIANGTVSNLAFLRGDDKAYLFLFYFETFTSVCRKCAFFRQCTVRLYRKSGWCFFCEFA